MNNCFDKNPMYNMIIRTDPTAIIHPRQGTPTPEQLFPTRDSRSGYTTPGVGVRR